MHVPSDHRLRGKRAAGIRRHDLTDLAERVLREPLAVHVLPGLRVQHHQLAVGVVRRGATVERRLDRNRLDAPILGQARWDDRPPPHVLTLGRDRVGLGGDDEIGRPQLLGELPLAGIGKRDRRRHVGGIAPRRSVVDPKSDRPHLRLAEPQVVLQLLDADVTVVPIRRHLAGEHPLLDGAGPGTHFLVGGQRHRSNRAGLVAVLTVLLQDGRHVLGKGRPRRGPVSGLTGLLRDDRGTDDVCENQEEPKGRDTGSEHTHHLASRILQLFRPRGARPRLGSGRARRGQLGRLAAPYGVMTNCPILDLGGDVCELDPQVAGVGGVEQPGRHGDHPGANKLLDLAVEVLHPVELAVHHGVEQRLALRFAPLDVLARAHRRP